MMGKLVDSLEVMFHRAGNYDATTFVISESELESALEKMPIYYGCKNEFGNFVLGDFEDGDTHTARIICIEELPKEPLKHEFETEAVSNNEFGKLYTNMIPSSFVGKKVRVTVEELR